MIPFPDAFRQAALERRKPRLRVWDEFRKLKPGRKFEDGPGSELRLHHQLREFPESTSTSTHRTRLRCIARALRKRNLVSYHHVDVTGWRLLGRFRTVKNQ